MEKFKLPTGILKINIDNENAVGLGLKKNNEIGQTGGKIDMNVENVGGFGVKNKGQKVVKSFKKINASKIPPNQWKRLSCKQRLSKVSWMLKKLVVWGWNNNEKEPTGGKIYMKITVSKIPPHQWKSSSHKLGFWKSTWMSKMLVVWG